MLPIEPRLFTVRTATSLPSTNSLLSMDTISYQDFERVELRVGKVTEVNDFPEAKKPAYKLTIDFGPANGGMKRSSAQVTELYTKEDLLGRLVVCVVNFAPKQIGPFMSECLTCGAKDENGSVALLTVDKENIPIGSKIF